jgi:hypothetical protein
MRRQWLSKEKSRNKEESENWSTKESLMRGSRQMPSSEKNRKERKGRNKSMI